MAIKKRIFCDTNILIDIFDAERTFHKDALGLLWYQADNPESVELIASITSFKDAYYILTRLYKDEAQARDSISNVMGVLIKPVDMLASYGQEALASNEPDFEDALIRSCAEHEEAHVLITRDRTAFTSGNIPAMSAASFLETVAYSPK